MEVVTIQSDAFKQIMDRLTSLESYFNHVAKKMPLSEQWLDLEDTCKFLKVSKRTIQNYRNQGILTFSKVSGKYYFSASALEEHLKNHSHKAFNKPKNIF